MKLTRSFQLLKPFRNQVFPRSNVDVKIVKKDNSSEYFFKI